MDHVVHDSDTIWCPYTKGISFTYHDYILRCIICLVD